MSDIVIEHAGGILRVELNRPAQKKRLIKDASISQLREAVKIENQEFSERVRSAEAKEALSAFLEKRPPNFTNTATRVAVQ